MSRLRFGLLLALAFIVVAVAAFIVGLRAFDDGQPDPPPPAPSTTSSVAPNSTEA